MSASTSVHDSKDSPTKCSVEVKRSDRVSTPYAVIDLDIDGHKIMAFLHDPAALARLGVACSTAAIELADAHRELEAELAL